MGFFSWKTQDTDKSICNKYSCRKPFTVYLTDNKGNCYREDDYEGYGKFGDVDFYSLLDLMNGGIGDRIDGIDKAYSNDNTILFPNLSETPDWKWRKERPKDCERQGYFYDESFSYDGEEDDDFEKE